MFLSPIHALSTRISPTVEMLNEREERDRRNVRLWFLSGSPRFYFRLDDGPLPPFLTAVVLPSTAVSSVISSIFALLPKKMRETR